MTHIISAHLLPKIGHQVICELTWSGWRATPLVPRRKTGKCPFFKAIFLWNDSTQLHICHRNSHLCPSVGGNVALSCSHPIFKALAFFIFQVRIGHEEGCSKCWSLMYRSPRRPWNCPSLGWQGRGKMYSRVLSPYPLRGGETTTFQELQ